MSSDVDTSKRAYVPESFDDLRRNTRSDRAPIPLKIRRETDDITSLVTNHDVIKQSKTAIFVAAAIFMIVAGLFYYRPLIDTVSAFHTAGGIAADKAATLASQTKGTVGTLGQILARAKTVDGKAVNIGLNGVACLNGTKACPK